MPGTKEIVRRIKSIKSTRKITKAMQMVSAAKMRKAQTQALASRSYSHLAWDLIRRVVGGEEGISHPLLAEYPKAKKIGVVVISSNRGLVGSFNTNLLGTLSREERNNSEFIYELVVLGKKARDAVARQQKRMIAEFPKYDSVPPIEEIYGLTRMLTEHYQSGAYQKIVVVYNHFVSTLVQEPKVKQLLPIVSLPSENDGGSQIYEFEPGKEQLLATILPRIVESQIYQAILESDASEHSARMVMMKNATEAAAELIDDLTLTYNQLRQNKITTELAEITAGKIALEDR